MCCVKGKIENCTQTWAYVGVYTYIRRNYETELQFMAKREYGKNAQSTKKNEITIIITEYWLLFCDSPVASD